MTPAILLRQDVDRPIRFRTPQSSRSPSPNSRSSPRYVYSHEDLESMTVPLSRYPTKNSRHGDSRLSIVAANTGRDGAIMLRRNNGSRGSGVELPYYYKRSSSSAAVPDHRAADDDYRGDEDAIDDDEAMDSDANNAPRTSNSSIYSRVSNRARKDAWAEIDDYVTETAEIMRRLNRKLVSDYDGDEQLRAQQFYEANMALLRTLEDRHKTLDDLMESANLASPASKSKKSSYRDLNVKYSREGGSSEPEYSASPMTVTFSEPFNDSSGGGGGGRMTPITLWGEEKERRLRELEAELKVANKKWSPRQEDILEEIEVLREERRKAKKLRRMTAPNPERRGSTFSLKSIGSFKKSRRNSGASNTSKSSKGFVTNFF